MARLVRAATDRNPPTLGGGGCQVVFFLSFFTLHKQILLTVKTQERLPIKGKRKSQMKTPFSQETIQ